MSTQHSPDCHVTKENYDAGKHGKDYEIEISKFMLKRLIEKEYTNFKFTREKKGLGKFDDLTILYEENGTKRFSLVQIKHLADQTKSIDFDALAINKSSYFYLPKYFEHYLESLKYISLDADFKDVQKGELIMCTNVGLEDDLKGIDKYPLKEEGLFTNSGKLFRLSMTKDMKRMIFKQSYESESSKLAYELSSHILFSKHLNVGSFIKDEHVSLIKKYHVTLALHVIDVEKRKFQTGFLLGDFGNDPDMYSFRLKLFKEIKEFFEKIKDCQTEDLKAKLNIKQKLAECISCLLEKYLSLDFVQFLEFLPIYTKSGFGDASVLEKNPQNILNEDVCHDEIDKQIDDFLDVLTFAVDQTKNDCILKEELGSNIFMAYSDKINEWYHKGSFNVYDGSYTRKREWISKERLVSRAMSSDIIFQGRKFLMKDIVSDEKFLDSNVLLNVFCSSEITLGNEVRSSDEFNKYYISRTLLCRRKLDKQILLERQIDVVILSTTGDTCAREDIEELIPQEDVLYDLNSLKQQTRFIYVLRNFSKDDFEKFTKKYSQLFDWMDIHWCEFDGHSLLWKSSFGSFFILQKYILHNDESCKQVSEKDLSEDNRFIIITGEPGMGKSTLFQHFAEHAMETNTQNKSPYWLMNVTLKDCTQNIDGDYNLKGIDDVVEVLADIEREHRKFYKVVLKQHLLSGRFILMLDGFDELRNGRHKQKIIELLKAVQSTTNVYQVWIATRPHCKEVLENCLGVVSFSVEEISEEQQIYFLSKYWAQHAKKPQEYISQYTKTLVKTFYDHVKNHERNLLGIPLQTYMFAVVFQNKIAEDRPLIQDAFQLTSLFKHFLHSKYELYLNKSGPLMLSDDVKQLLLQSFDEVHQDFALMYGGHLPPDDAQLFILNRCTLSVDSLLEIGIVYKLSDSFQFVHKTFSEYLTAKRIAEYVLGSNTVGNVTSVLEKLIENPENEFLLYLFDIEVTENFPLHRSVLKGDDAKIRELKPGDIGKRDYLGRSLAYYAVQYGHFNIMKMLILMKGFSGEINVFLLKSLTAFLKKSYASHSETVPKNTVKIFSELMRYAVHYILKLLDVFDLHLEMRRKNWLLARKLLEVRKHTRQYGNSLDYFESALKCKAPFDLVLKILSNIWHEGNIDPSLISYSNFMTYLFDCDPKDIELLLQRYKTAFKENYVKLPLSVGVFEYFDIKDVRFTDSFESSMNIIKRRAEQYTTIVRLLLENGSSYIVPRKEDENDIFSKSMYNFRLLKQPIATLLDDIFTPEFTFIDESLMDLKNEIKTSDQATSSREVSLAKKEVWSFLELYLQNVPLDMNQSVKSAVVNVALHILKSSESKALLLLVYKFFKAVELNDYDTVSESLKEAKKRGWVRALLRANGSKFKVAEEVAQANMSLRVLFVLRKFRVGLREFLPP